jgi:uncharacterized membrane protein
MNALADLILKEGWRPIGMAVGAALVFALLGLELFALLGLAAAVLLVMAYRRPVRTVSNFEKSSVTSPCDGRVTSVETASDGSVVVEIDTGCLDASVLTLPFDGSMTHRFLTRGARLPRKSALFGPLNEHGSVIFESSGGHVVRVTHTLLRCSAPLVLDAVSDSGKRFGRAARYGVMVEGITRLHLPASTRVAVNPGEKVLATETLLGYMG